MKHRFRTLGRWLALASIAGASTVGLAPQAGAYTGGDSVPTIDVINCTAAGGGSVAPDPIDIPTLAFGTTGQAAGCWAIQADPGEAWQNGDQVIIAVDDADGDFGAGDPLATTPGNVVFSAAPTVKLGTQTLSNVTLLDGGRRLRVTVTGLSAPTFADMVITNVKYDVGFGPDSADDTQYGPIDVAATVNGSAATPGAALVLLGDVPSNGFLSDVSVTANDPEVGLDLNTADGSAATADGTFSDITIKEANTSALPAGGPQTICVAPAPALDVVDFKTANVSKTAGDATAVGITVTEDLITITFTNATPRTAANTFKITGIGVDMTHDDTPGRHVVVVTDCEEDGDTFSPLTTVGAVVDQDRTGGSDRFQTARRIAEDKLEEANAAVIARGDDFADALAAAGLAGKVADEEPGEVPILLTNTNSIPTATLNALSNLEVETVYIVGGTQAVSQSVENQLRNKPTADQTEGPFCPGSDTTRCLRVVRIAGADRFATAQEIADFMGAAGTVDLDKSDGLSDDLKTAFLARGDVFADALAVGPLAYQGAFESGDGDPMPILLTQSNALSPAAAAALIDLGIEQVVIAGGTSAVSDAVKSAVESMGINVVRVGGTNRQHTAALIAGMALDPDTFEFEGECSILARGDNFPDALAAGPFGGGFECPIVLTENPGTLGVFSTGFLDLASALALPDLEVVGETAAVSAAAAAAARNALSGTTLQP